MASGLKEGIRLLRDGDADGAAEIFSKLLRSQPGDGQAHLWLGNARLLAGDLSGAVASFRSTVEHGDAELQSEARRQISAVRYQRLLNLLVVRPKLRFLLIAGGVGALVAFALRHSGHPAPAGYVYAVSVYGLIPLSFAWLIFIISFIVTDFAGRSDSTGRSVKMLLVAVGLVTVGANALLMAMPQLWRAAETTLAKLAWIVPAAALDLFCLSLGASWLLKRYGRKLTDGDEET